METPGCNDAATITKNSCDSEKYRRCSLLNNIQHIDIYGKYRSTYVVRTARTRFNLPTSWHSVSCVATTRGKRAKTEDEGKGSLEDKLNRMSVTTRVSGLWPGHDISSKKKRNCRGLVKQGSKEPVKPTYVPR